MTTAVIGATGRVGSVVVRELHPPRTLEDFLHENRDLFR